MHDFVSGADIQTRLAVLASDDSSIEHELNSCRRSGTRAAFQHLQELRALDQAAHNVTVDAYDLVRRVAIVSDSAAGLAEKVRQLDDEQSRVSEALRVVQVVQDLKASLQALDAAKLAQDWEAASRQYKRLRSFDQSIVSSPFAEVIVPTSESPLPPLQRLDNSKNELLAEFESRFQDASAKSDALNINRFFRLFPDIEASEAGLRLYAEWAGTAMNASYSSAKGTERSPAQTIAALSSMFESVASIVSQHQPVVERYYGLGHMHIVIKILLSRCSSTCAQMLSDWESSQSLSSRAALSRQIMHSIQNEANFNRICSLSEGRLEARPVDVLLTELATVRGRWQLLRKFVWDHLEFDSQDSSADASKTGAEGTDKALTVPNKLELLLEETLQRNEFATRLNAALQGSYTDIDAWHVAFCTQTAHDSEEIDFKANPLLSTSVDDAFHAYRRCTQRCVSFGDLDALASAIKHVCRAVKLGLVGKWRQTLQGLAQEHNNGRRDQDGVPGQAADPRTMSILLLNNLATASEYSSRLNQETALGVVEFFHNDQSRQSARQALDPLAELSERIRDVNEAELSTFFNTFMRSQLRPLMAEAHKHITYVLSEEAYAEAQYRNELVNRFRLGWDKLFGEVKLQMTPSNFDALFGMSTTFIARTWEGILRSLKFNEFGALQFDRDVRGVVSLLATSSSTSSAVLRENFARLFQISQVLLLDDEAELQDLMGQRLSKAEMHMVRQLRVDSRM